MDRKKEIVKVSYKGIATNIVLVAFKAFIGLMANSIAVILDAVNNLSDALSSVITIIGTKLAGRAPDKKHPYGYGRIEYLTSSVIAIIVLIAGLTSLKESVMKIINPEKASYTAVSLIVIGAAVAVKFVLGSYFKKKGSELNSQSLTASGTDAHFDAVISVSTFLCAVANMIFDLNLEGIVGVVISLFILKAGIEMIGETMNSIIGVRVDKELADGVKEKLCSHSEVHGAYDLILNSYGPEEIIGSVHVEVDDDITVKQFHSLSRALTQEVYTDFGIILTIGAYASNTSNPKSAEMRKSIEEEIKKYPHILQMHGFYVDEINSEVYFDLIFDFDEENRESIVAKIVDKLKENYPEFSFNPILDRDFSD